MPLKWSSAQCAVEVLDEACVGGNKCTQNYAGTLIMLENYYDLALQRACNYSMPYS